MVVSSTGILERVELMHSTDSFPPVSQYKLEKEWNYRLVSKVERVRQSVILVRFTFPFTNTVVGTVAMSGAVLK